MHIRLDDRVPASKIMFYLTVDARAIERWEGLGPLQFVDEVDGERRYLGSSVLKLVLEEMRSKPLVTPTDAARRFMVRADRLRLWAQAGVMQRLELPNPPIPPGTRYRADQIEAALRVPLDANSYCPIEQAAEYAGVSVPVIMEWVARLNVRLRADTIPVVALRKIIVQIHCP